MAHAVQLSKKCLSLEKRIFTVDNFASNEEKTLHFIPALL